MQVTINETHPDELIYPYVGKLQNGDYLTIVLFVDNKEGVILLSTDPINKVGQTIRGWTENKFTKCSVTLL